MNQPNRLRLSKLSLGLIVALAAAPAFAQSTSAGVGGVVVGADGKPVTGADVTITHVESGTVNHATTDSTGRYNARGLRVGGPYKITVNKDGVGSSAQNDVYLQLDQVVEVDATLSAGAKSGAGDLETIKVVGAANAATFTSDNKGVGTNITRQELERMPAPDRSIQNIVRADPRVVVTDRDRGAFSALGQNFRYNSITVDNINVGDPFGLNDNGLPTKGSPISPEAIESWNVSTANFDVATRRGVGAVVNAVTKSGSNSFHGSAYFTYQNADDMVGKNASGAKWSGWGSNSTKGVSLGGPLVQDKLFFFLDYEESRKTSPGAIYGATDSNATIKVPGLTQANVDAIIAAARVYGMNPGDATSVTEDLTSKRALVKFDWNINDSHRASLRLGQTKEFEPILSSGSFATGSSPTLALSSNWYGLDKKVNNASLSFYDDWSTSFSTEATVAYNKFSQLRGPMVGGYQPQVTVRTSGADTGPSVVFGTEASSQANELRVKTWNAYLAGNWFVGNHVIKGGFDYQSDDFYNLFLQRVYGDYVFNSIADFQSGTYRRYRLNIPAPGFDMDGVAAVFKQHQYGLFLQDTWQMTDRLSVQYGLRYDLIHVNPDPANNPCFSAAPGVASLTSATVNYNGCGLRSNPTNPNAAVGGFGFSNQGTIDGLTALQPRFSFNYNFDTEHSTQLRGGAGLFISNTPTVWVANPYSNNGISVAGYDINRRRLATDPVFSPNANAQNVPGARTLPGLGTSTMTVSVVDPDFKIPEVAKFTLGLDKELGWKNLVFTAEYQHLDVIKGILYQNLNLGAPTGVLPDGRLSYARTPTAAPGSTNTTRWNSNPSFGSGIIYLTNTNKGKSDSFTVMLKKPFSNNWSASFAYTHTNATDVNPGTSSVAESSYQNRTWANPNDDLSSVSNYSIPNRFVATFSWQHRFFGENATAVSLFYDGHDGAPYSWIFGNDVNGDSYVHDLAYVPSGDGSDVVWANAASQALAPSFYQYVSSHPELSRYRGHIVGRNQARAPWVNQLDLSVKQEFPGFAHGHKAEVRFDIFNVLNMINKDWGVEHRANFPLERTFANYAGVCTATVTPTCPAGSKGRYIYDISGYSVNGAYSPQTLPVNESQNPSQRWSVLLTLRYKF